MKLRILGFVCSAVLLAGAAAAQTKVTGHQDCAKPDVAGTIDAGDKTGHTLTLQKFNCTWSTGMEMAGLKSKDGGSAELVEAWSNRTTTTGTYVGNMDNGDKFFCSFHDSASVKDGKPAIPIKGTWSYSGGTGKLKGIKGKGTYTVTLKDDGSSSVDVEGDYDIPAAAPAKTPKSK
jgi:hypothetical protein